VVKLAEFVLTAVGIIWLITHASIFAWFRVAWVRSVPAVLSPLVYCGGCTGFWVGLALGAGGYWPTGRAVIDVLQAGAAAMGVGAAFMGLQLSPFDYEMEKN